MLNFKAVSKQFSKIKAVDTLSFEVQKGEIFALLGPNGAGKTTTVRMIMQIIEPDTGSIQFDQELLKNGSVNRSLLGYLPEERGLYQDAPILKTLIYLASLRGSDPKTTASQASEWLKRFELFDRRNDKISTLSKGNQQKIQFIASILHSPKFAILDEPYSGFDPINQELISDYIRELRDHGMTILMSAHQMHLVESIADRILMISDGKELISGTMDEIRSKTISDQKLTVKYNAEPNFELLDPSTLISSYKFLENQTYEVYYPNLSNLNLLINDLTKVGEIQSLQTSSMSLHEIFIQSFKQGDQNGS